MRGCLSSVDTEILVDSGSSVSLVRDDLASMVPTNNQTNKDEFPVLLTASGSERLSIVVKVHLNSKLAI